MPKRVKGAAERPQALAGVPRELERWALGEAQPQRRSRSRPSRPSARRAGSAAARTLRGVTSTVQRALPDSTGGVAATAALALGAALIEVELLPGILLGAGAMLLGAALPRLRASARPMFKSVVAAGLAAYDSSRRAVAGAAGQMEEMMGEVRREAAPKARAPARSSRRRSRGAASQVAELGASAAAGAVPEVAAEAL